MMQETKYIWCHICLCTANMTRGVLTFYNYSLKHYNGKIYQFAYLFWFRRHFERHPPHSPGDQEYAIDQLEAASYQPVGKPRDAGADGGSNNYYRTWQLQQQQQQQQQQLLHPSGQAASPAFHDGDSSATTGNYKQPSITCSEHVYESPTFERHADGPFCGSKDDESSMRAKYFVLDPDTVISRTGDDRSAVTRFLPPV